MADQTQARSAFCRPLRVQKHVFANVKLKVEAETQEQ
jgi:hypothetical protein